LDYELFDVAEKIKSQPTAAGAKRVANEEIPKASRHAWEKKSLATLRLLLQLKLEHYTTFATALKATKNKRIVHTV
jgi:hypothetical protein